MHINFACSIVANTMHVATMVVPTTLYRMLAPLSCCLWWVPITDIISLEHATVAGNMQHYRLQKIYTRSGNMHVVMRA